MKYERLTFRYESVDGTKQVGYTEKLIPCFNKQTMILNRLAELEDEIEQGTLKEEKTCENIFEMHPTDGFTCSECRITIIDYIEERVNDDYYANHYEYEFKYCPNCGAKVVH